MPSNSMINCVSESMYPLLLQFPEPHSELKKPDLSPNCLTYLLPEQDQLADRQTKKLLVLRKISDRPLLLEDVAAQLYHKYYFAQEPPKLSLRAGPRPKQPEALHSLEEKPIGFCFKAQISLDSRFRIGSTDLVWPCYLLSGFEEVADPNKHIIQPKPGVVRVLYSQEDMLAHQQRLDGYQLRQSSDDSDDSNDESPPPKRHRSQWSSGSPEPSLTASETTKNEVSTLVQQALAEYSSIEQQERESLRLQVAELQQQLDARSQKDRELLQVEAGFERLLREAYREWREHTNSIEEKAADAMKRYERGIAKLKSRVKSLEEQQTRSKR